MLKGILGTACGAMDGQQGSRKGYEIKAPIKAPRPTPDGPAA